MDPIQNSDVNNSLRLLAEAPAGHRDEIRSFPTDAEAADSSEENDSQCTAFDKFCEEGQLACIKSMTNISPDQF